MLNGWNEWVRYALAWMALLRGLVGWLCYVYGLETEGWRYGSACSMDDEEGLTLRWLYIRASTMQAPFYRISTSHLSRSDHRLNRSRVTFLSIVRVAWGKRSSRRHRCQWFHLTRPH